ncbi:hypothetical protein PoB_002001200 [Plakobranchus ocellatus]|uniref:Uncharacterized protein n=1 Tax=Plakobranchus ocellatus TaxID=259542 RepID=A0AAV3ZG99_9GAST|nr:hypothetical protein PoB_002001200 [Plakobranchus ocellatus]
MEPGKQCASRPSSTGASASSSTIDAPANAASLPALLRASPVCEPAIGSESGDSDENIGEDRDEEWQPPTKTSRHDSLQIKENSTRLHFKLKSPLVKDLIRQRFWVPFKDKWLR